MLKTKITPASSHPVYKEISQMHDWYLRAKPGDFYVYYVGENLTENIVASTLKNKAWELALQGRVYLFRKLIKREKLFSEYHFIMYKPREKLEKFIPK